MFESLRLVASADRSRQALGAGVARRGTGTRTAAARGIAAARSAARDRAVVRRVGLYSSPEGSKTDFGTCGAAALVHEKGPPVIEVIRVAAELQAVCETEGWRFCFIGGLALQRWGEPRETVDVDLTLLTGFGGEEPFIQKLLQRFEARVADAAQFALTRRVLLLRSTSGVGIDIALGGLPFEESAVSRSSPFAFPSDVFLRTCSAEDLIVMKAFAARSRDWADIEGVIIRQTGKLDWSYIHQQLAPLAELKEAPGILDELEKRRVEFER